MRHVHKYVGLERVEEIYSGENIKGHHHKTTQKHMIYKYTWGSMQSEQQTLENSTSTETQEADTSTRSNPGAPRNHPA